MAWGGCFHFSHTMASKVFHSTKDVHPYIVHSIDVFIYASPRSLHPPSLTTFLHPSVSSPPPPPYFSSFPSPPTLSFALPSMFSQESTDEESNINSDVSDYPSSLTDLTSLTPSDLAQSPSLSVGTAVSSPLAEGAETRATPPIFSSW